MTENEAIKQLQVGYLGDTEDLVQAKHIAIKALEEIQQYRAIGTVEDIQMIFQLCKDLQVMCGKYHEIGTVEEFKALKEKNVAKKPIYSDFDDNGDDEIIPYKAICPVCGNEFEFGYWNDEYNHHCVCGQKIDW